MNETFTVVKTAMPLLVDREMALLLAVLCSVYEKLGAQVVWSSKVVGLEHPSLEIIEAIFATSDKGCRPQGQARCLKA